MPTVNPAGGVGPVLLVGAAVSPGEATAVKVTVTPLPADTLTLVPAGVFGETLATKASKSPPPRVVWKAPAVVGKLAEAVIPAT